jgi:hypothetical protein
MEQSDSRRLDITWIYAESLHSDGRYKEAEVAFEQVFKIRRKTLREVHPKTLTSIGNLASTYG